MSVFSQLLDSYQFSSKQQLAIIQLMFLAGAFEPDELQESLRVMGHDSQQIAQAIELVKKYSNKTLWKPTLDSFDAEELQKNLFGAQNNCAPEVLLKAHNWLVYVTQKYFYMRDLHQERWDIVPPEWLEKNLKHIQELAHHTGVFEAQLPTQKSYDAFVILGATTPVMQTRIRFCKHLVENYGAKAGLVLLLASDRPLEDWEKIDALDLKTEADMMLYLYTNLKGERQFAKIPNEQFRVPMMGQYRPTRIETVAFFANNVDQVGQNPIKRLLYISGAPDIRSQNEDVQQATWKYFDDAKAEIVGPASPTSLSSEARLHLVTRAISALGGRFYGGYERVATILGSLEPMDVLQAKKLTLVYHAPYTPYSGLSFGV